MILGGTRAAHSNIGLIDISRNISQGLGHAWHNTLHTTVRVVTRLTLCQALYVLRSPHSPKILSNTVNIFRLS